MADSIGLLVIARIFPRVFRWSFNATSQTLLLRIFPKEKQEQLLECNNDGTLLAPVIGPILGGYICDEYSWECMYF